MKGMHQVSGKRRYGVFLALVAVLFWGVLPVVLRVLLEGLDAFTIVWFRFAGAAVLLGPYIFRRFGFAPVFRIRGIVVLLTIVTVVGLGGNYVTYALGVKLMSPSMAAVMIQVAPMMVLIGGLVIFRERFSLFQWVGLVLLLAGLGLFFHRSLGKMLSGVNHLSIGVAVIILSALVWAAYVLAQKQLLRYFPSELIMFRLYLGGIVLLFPFSHPARILSLDPVRLGLLLFTPVNTLIAYGCFSEALDHLEASRVSLVIAVVPLVTLAAAAAGAACFPRYLTPEVLDPVGLLGACLVVGGSMLGSFARRPSPG